MPSEQKIRIRIWINKDVADKIKNKLSEKLGPFARPDIAYQQIFYDGCALLSEDAFHAVQNQRMRRARKESKLVYYCLHHNGNTMKRIFKIAKESFFNGKGSIDMVKINVIMDEANKEYATFPEDLRHRVLDRDWIFMQQFRDETYLKKQMQIMSTQIILGETDD